MKKLVTGVALIGICAAVFAVGLSQLPPIAAYAQPLTPPAVGVGATSGNVAAATATATLPAAPNRITYICGVSVSGLGATAGTAVLGTITNLNQTMSFNVGVPAGATVPLTQHLWEFAPCLPSSAPNQTIVVSIPSFGAGNTNASVTAWGYQGN